MREPLDLKHMPRPEKQRYDKCAAGGCGRTPRAYSRFCTVHARAYANTRDPNGRAVRVREIKPYRELADIYLARSAEHPAVVAAIELFRAHLLDTTLPGAIRKQLLRLRLDAAEPRDMLLNFLGVWGLSHFLPHTVNNDACETFNLGNRVLRTTPMHSVQSRTGKRNPTRLPARVAEEYGWILRAKLGLFAIRFWKHVEAELEASDRAAEAVSLAVRDKPFAS